MFKEEDLLSLRVKFAITYHLLTIIKNNTNRVVIFDEIDRCETYGDLSPALETISEIVDTRSLIWGTIEIFMGPIIN